MTTRRTWLAPIITVLVVATLMSVSIEARAFPFTFSWHEPAAGRAGMNRAGAGGLYGTGGVQDFGIRCSHCHTPSPGRDGTAISLRVDAVPAFDTLAGERAYVPGRRYAITVRLLGEHLREAYMSHSVNGFALAIEDASGRRAGRFWTDAGQDSASCPRLDPGHANRMHLPGGPTTLMYGDCHAVLFQPTIDLTSWTFDWQAPAAGSGDLTIFVAVVDGNERGESSLKDDVVEQQIPLREGS